MCRIGAGATVAHGEPGTRDGGGGMFAKMPTYQARLRTVVTTGRRAAQMPREGFDSIP
jgi:hypothetical protein